MLNASAEFEQAPMIGRVGTSCSAQHEDGLSYAESAQNCKGSACSSQKEHSGQRGQSTEGLRVVSVEQTEARCGWRRMGERNGLHREDGEQMTSERRHRPDLPREALL